MRGPRRCIQILSPDWFIDAGCGDACSFGAVIIGSFSSFPSRWALNF
ncbi:hypothetical protein CGCSCA4_v008340 [Colletotrichum siamense]|uniref:Uncharacterized protein n=1 Tax=Colletotrichum siamense TaxID=690259 RepID=A0A9P5EP72_COLSI|nr:hypothetical protein CGCSCA4_v008340 [Colletotrichum siamense]KAF4856462.1 hypothetical protein CGCSCA2_v008660 [Colletotrichum siamense]